MVPLFRIQCLHTHVKKYIQKLLFTHYKLDIPKRNAEDVESILQHKYIFYIFNIKIMHLFEFLFNFPSNDTWD